MSKLLRKPLSISKGKEVFDNAYLLFREEILKRENRPKLFNKFIFIDENIVYDDKEWGFWHVVSIGEDDTKYDMFPCQNHKAFELCEYQCDVDHPENFLKDKNSIPCLYRAQLINWITDIIRLANENKDHPNLRIWKKIFGKRREKRLLIRYIDHPIDYVLIFQIVYNEDKSDIRYYKFITAYPVVLKSYKRRFDKEYKDYKKSI